MRPSYSDLLRDPRWQRKRLEIMERDDFSCRQCGTGEHDGVPLNVHHVNYERGAKPWEYGDAQLLTLCDDCHAYTEQVIRVLRQLASYEGRRVADAMAGYGMAISLERWQSVQLDSPAAVQGFADGVEVEVQDVRDAMDSDGTMTRENAKRLRALGIACPSRFPQSFHEAAD